MALDRATRERLIEQYAAGPARLKAALAAVPPAALQWRPKDIEREEIEKKVKIIVMQEESSEEPPVFMIHEHGVGLECAEPVKADRFLPVAMRDFENKRGEVQKN